MFATMAITQSAAAFAGLWEGWKDPSGAWIKTCTILTTTPNAVTSAIHDRMPVVLDASDYDVWLDPGLKDAAIVAELLKPFDANPDALLSGKQPSEQRRER